MAPPCVQSQEALLCLPVWSQEHAGDTERSGSYMRRAGQSHKRASTHHEQSTGEHVSDQSLRIRLHEGGTGAHVLQWDLCSQAPRLAFAREPQNWQAILGREQVHVEHM